MTAEQENTIVAAIGLSSAAQAEDEKRQPQHQMPSAPPMAQPNPTIPERVGAAVGGIANKAQQIYRMIKDNVIEHPALAVTVALGAIGTGVAVGSALRTRLSLEVIMANQAQRELRHILDEDNNSIVLEKGKNRPSKRKRRGAIFEFYDMEVIANFDRDNVHVEMTDKDGNHTYQKWTKDEWRDRNNERHATHVRYFGDDRQFGGDEYGDSKGAQDRLAADVARYDAAIGRMQHRVAFPRPVNLPSMAKSNAAKGQSEVKYVLDCITESKLSTYAELEAHSTSVSVPLKAMQNCILLQFYFPDSTIVVDGTGFAVAGKLIFTCVHNFYNNNVLAIRATYSDNSGTHRGDIPDYAIRDMVIFGKDVAVLVVPKLALPPSFTLSLPVNGASVLVTAKKDKTTNKITHLSQGNIIKLNIVETYDSGSAGFEPSDVPVLHHSCQSEKGSSGGPVIATDVSGAVTVMAVHTGRSANKNGMAVPVTQEMIDFVLKHTSSPPAVRPATVKESKVERKFVVKGGESKCQSPGCGFVARFGKQLSLHGSEMCQSVTRPGQVLKTMNNKTYVVPPQCNKQHCHFKHTSQVNWKYWDLVNGTGVPVQESKRVPILPVPAKRPIPKLVLATITPKKESQTTCSVIGCDVAPSVVVKNPVHCVKTGVHECEGHHLGQSLNTGQTLGTPSGSKNSL